MEIKKLLLDLGYSENQVNSIVNKEKVYFQDDVDNIVSKSKERLEQKRERDYVSKADYDSLLSEHNNLTKEVKSNEIKQHFLANGGNEKYFNDFMKVNQNLFDIESSKISETIKLKSNENEWAFNNKATPKAPFGFDDNSNKGGNGFDGETIY